MTLLGLLVYTVDMVHTVDMAYTVDMVCTVYTIDMVDTVDTVLTLLTWYILLTLFNVYTTRSCAALRAADLGSSGQDTFRARTFEYDNSTVLETA